MFENGLFDQAYYSFEGAWTNWLDDLHAFAHYPVITDQITKHKDKFPIRLNITTARENPINLELDDIQYHDDSYFSLVTETIYYKKNSSSSSIGMASSEDAIFITEKTYKAMLFKHPFIIAGFTNSLKTIKELGFKTFHPYIDESYDSIEDDDQRLEAITKEVERLCAFTDAEWLNWQTNVKDIVEHNFDVIMNRQQYGITTNVDQMFNK
jgi:hypothetical protein